MTQKQYKFSLSIRDKHHRTVKKIVDGLLEKGNGALSQSIRDGLRLLNDLRRGNVTVLLDMFPDIVDKLCPPSTPDTDDMERRIADAVATRLKGELQQHSMNYEIPDSRNAGFPAMSPAPKQAGQGIGKLASHKIELPRFTDDDIDDGATIVLNRSTNTSTGQNLLAGIFGLD